MARPDPTRRALLVSLAASPAVMLGTRPLVAQGSAAAAAGLISPNVCLLTPELAEGPFYTDPQLVRSDITEGKEGVALEMVIQVVDASCQPMAGARVDIWHCDALGNYSGFATQGSDGTVNTSSETFLRGTQFADERGVVTFRTIYPGWYRGRTTHIHHKVLLDETDVVTGQIFFPDALSQYLFENAAPYDERRAERDTLNANDWIAAQAGEGAYAAVREAPSRYVATLVIGVDPTAESEGGMRRSDTAAGETGERKIDPGALVPDQD